LPKEALLEAGLADFSPSAALADPNLGLACAAVADKAREHFDESSLLMKACSARTVKAPYLMAAAYRSILERLVARGFTPPRAPVKASRIKILLALVRSAIS
jgi:phytoene synthase